MPDGNRTGRDIPWWRSPGAILLWALIAAAIVVIFGDPLIEHIAGLLVEE